MINYLKGDATVPQAKGTKLIIHVCNSIGGWGRGFVLALSRRWLEPEVMYRRWYNNRVPINHPEPGQIVMTSGSFKLGEAQLVMVKPGLAVVNMIAQEGTKTGSKGPPIRYDALEKTLNLVNGYADSFKASIHCPRLGCSLAGGSWAKVEPLIQKTLGARDVFVYDFENSTFNP